MGVLAGICIYTLAHVVVNLILYKSGCLFPQNFVYSKATILHINCWSFNTRGQVYFLHNIFHKWTPHFIQLSLEILRWLMKILDVRFFGFRFVKPCWYWQKINSHSGCGWFHHNKVAMCTLTNHIKVSKLYKYKGKSVASKSSRKNVLKVL